MARPNKPISLSSGVITLEERERRTEMEQKLRGGTNKLKPPTNLTKRAKKYFKQIVEQLAEVNVLGNGDIGIITLASTTRDKFDRLEEIIQTSSDLEEIKSCMRLQSGLGKDLRGYYNDLGLTPASRSKLASMKIEKDEEKSDPLLQALTKLNNRK